jgi:hypothetical protein
MTMKANGRSRLPLMEVPFRGSRVQQPFVRELFQDQNPLPMKQSADLLESNLEIGHVMEGSDRDHSVEWPTVLELFDPNAAEDPPSGRHRINRDNLVPLPGQGPSQRAISTSDLENSGRRAGQEPLQELEVIQVRSNRRNAAPT